MTELQLPIGMTVVVVALGLGSIWVGWLVRGYAIKAYVVCQLNDQEIFRDTIQLRNVREIKKLKGSALKRMLGDNQLVINIARAPEIDNLPGYGGGRRRKISVPVFKGVTRIPGWLVIEARW